MPSVETQTSGEYTIIDNLEEDRAVNTILQFTSKYTSREIFVFSMYYKKSGNNKSIMTSYNSKLVYYMDSVIKQIIDSGDY